MTESEIYFHFLAYMIKADGEVKEEETTQLKESAANLGINSAVKQEIEKILEISNPSELKHGLGLLLEEIAKLDNVGLLLNMFKDAIMIADSDGDLCDKEKNLICSVLALYCDNPEEMFLKFRDWARRMAHLEEEGVAIYNLMTMKVEQ